MDTADHLGILSTLTEKTFDDVRFAVAISDPNLPDNPLVWVNDAFCAVTGYGREEVLGRNCRFLQGTETDPDAIATMREAFATGREVAVDLVNYRRDGTPFNNRLMVTPVGAVGAPEYFVGFQSEVDRLVDARVEMLDERLRELQHRVKNHLALVVAMIRRNARELEPQAAARALVHRVEALALLHVHLDEARGLDESGRVHLGAYLSQVCGAMQALSDNVRLRVSNDMDDVRSDADTAANIGMVVCELVTNALQHAFAPEGTGVVAISAGRDGDHVRVTVSDDGVGLGDSGWPDGAGLGGAIVRSLVERAGGRLEVASGSAGTTVRLLFPAG